MEVIMSEMKDIRGPEPSLFTTPATIAEHSRVATQPVQLRSGIHSITDKQSHYERVVDSVYIRGKNNKKGQYKLYQSWTSPYKVLAQKALFQVILQLRNLVTGKTNTYPHSYENTVMEIVSNTT